MSTKDGLIYRKEKNHERNHQCYNCDRQLVLGMADTYHHDRRRTLSDIQMRLCADQEIRVHMLTDFRKDVPESRKRQDILLRSCLCSPRLDHRVLQHSRSACGHRPRRTGSRILDVAHSHRGLLHQILRDRPGGQV